MRPAVLLDRDGTINDDVGYLTDIANLVIYPFAVDAIRLLRRAGYAIVVITNQGGVARGLSTTAFVEETHRRMAATLDAGGAHVDAWRYCPHHPDGTTPELARSCQCRKPEPGMALDAARELDLDLARSWVVGDHWRDVQLGHAVGARSILLRTGHGRDQEAARQPGQRVEAICDNLMHAVAVDLDGSRPNPIAVTSTTELLRIIDRFADARVVVLGDLIADEYVYGRVARVSREAPVLILEYDSTEIVPGGAGNAATNVAALGAVAYLASVAGRDEPGRRVIAALPRGVDRRGLVRPAGFRTPVKTRILAGGIHSAKQQVVRIDRRSQREVSDRERRAVERLALRAVRQADAVLISDYGSGLVTPRFAAQLARALAGRGVPVLVDSRFAMTRFRRLTAAAPNESEVEQALGLRIDDQPRVLERAGRALLRKTAMKAVLITRGSRGMALFEPDKPAVHIPIFGSDQIADVTGAGDTVMATLTLALAAGADFEQAARLANYAGGLVVMKRGTATVSAAELRRAIRSDRTAAADSPRRRRRRAGGR